MGVAEIIAERVVDIIGAIVVAIVSWVVILILVVDIGSCNGVELGILTVLDVVAVDVGSFVEVSIVVGRGIIGGDVPIRPFSVGKELFIVMMLQSLNSSSLRLMRGRRSW